jgi:hypothetical protein
MTQPRMIKWEMTETSRAWSNHQHKGNQHPKQIHVAALSPPASSSLHEEAHCLLLTTKLASIHQVQNP